jgi:phosphate:Na+ symporter
VREAADALRQAQVFLSDVAGPPDTDDEQRRLTSTLHAGSAKVPSGSFADISARSVQPAPGPIVTSDLNHLLTRLLAAKPRQEPV